MASSSRRPLRVAINTGGGDAPGLNAVIYSTVVSALNLGWEVLGIRRGYEGLFAPEGGVIPLDRSSVHGIARLGGTILGTTNRGNPLRWPVEKDDGTVEMVDRSGEIIDEFRRREIDALIAIGGDGSLTIAGELHERGLPVVGVPKTIDNDLAATQVSFGFHTAVQTATDAVDKLRATAEAHERIMVVEVMGRHAGWIALYAGLSGSADAILIPELPYDLEKVAEAIRARFARGPRYSIVVVAEGAFAKGGEPFFKSGGKPGSTARYGGVAEVVSDELSRITDFESRALVLGHLQRGGQPTDYDRLLSLEFGAAAVDLVRDGSFGCMVALHPPKILAVPISDAVSELKTVPLDGDVIRTARRLGICFGD